MRRRVVITGFGSITPIGHTAEETFAAALRGECGVAAITRFDARGFPTKIASEVKNFDLKNWLPNASDYSKAGENTKFALVAAKQALEDASLFTASGIDRTRFGVYLGSGEGAEDFYSLIDGVGRATDASGYRANSGAVEAKSAFCESAQTKLPG